MFASDRDPPNRRPRNRTQNAGEEQDVNESKRDSWVVRKTRSKERKHHSEKKFAFLSLLSRQNQKKVLLAWQRERNEMVLPQDVLLLAGFDGFTAANSVGCDHFPGDEIYPRISGSAITRAIWGKKQNGWQLALGQNKKDWNWCNWVMKTPGVIEWMNVWFTRTFIDLYGEKSLVLWLDLVRVSLSLFFVRRAISHPVGIRKMCRALTHAQMDTHIHFPSIHIDILVECTSNK